MLLFTTFQIFSQKGYQLPEGKTQDDVDATHIFVKFKQQQGAQKVKLSLPFSVKQMRAVLPKTNAQSKSATNSTSVLDGLYQVELQAGDNVLERLEELSQHPDLEYACPIFREELLYVPNDPAAQSGTGSQGYLGVIKAYEAWDITTGSSDVTIAISDTGMDLDHEDLSNKLLANGDGTFGYDLADGDTDASSDFSPHGDRVGGIAGAQAENGLGMAGVAINSPLIPLKVFPTGSNFSRNAYESITYAADKGYDVINLSWGSPNSYTQALQDIINYAVLEKDLIVIAAAGNSNKDEPWYPASYDNVLSVASTDNYDSKAAFSTYNNAVDISAPGVNIYSTNAGGYGFYNGTSFSSPMVAGVAALVKSYYPGLNSLQIMERIRVTSDNHYSINTEPIYTGKLGHGRLNAHMALTAANLKSVRATNFKISGSNGNFLYYGDSIDADFKLTNILNPVNNVTIQLADNEGNVSFEEISNQSFLEMQEGKFKLRGLLNENVKPGTKLTLKLSVTGNDFSDYQQFDLNVATDNYTLETRESLIQISGNGNLAEGKGLKFNNRVSSTEFGLILSTSHNSVADTAPLILGETKNNDFITIKPIRPYHNSIASRYASSIFFSEELNVRVEQSIYSIDSIENGLLLSYRIINVSDSVIEKLNFGLFNNWNLLDKNRNKSRWDGTNTIIAESQDPTSFGATRILSTESKLYNNLDLASLNGNSSDLEDIFTDSLKHELLALKQFSESGHIGEGTDIANILGVQINDLITNKPVKLSFLIAGDTSLSAVEHILNKLEVFHSEFWSKPPLLQSESICDGGTVTINPTSGSTFNFYSDPAGKNLISSGSNLEFGPSKKDSSIYVTNLDSTYESEISRIDVKFLERVVDFEMSTDTLLLNEESINSVEFKDKSFEANSWHWIFSNGTSASSKNPTIIFDSVGTYNISLSITTVQGCSDIITKTLVVGQKPISLGLESISSCIGHDLKLPAPIDQLRVYNIADTSLIYQGQEFVFPTLLKDTSFILSNVVNGFESNLELVQIKAIDLVPSFSIIPDIRNLDNSDILFVNTTPDASTIRWNINGTEHFGDSVEIVLSDSIDLELEVITYGGCLGLTNENILLEKGPLPVLTLPPVICPKDTITIEPDNGNTFAFYLTPELQTAIAKGPRLQLTISDTTNLWITNIDNGLPSDPVQTTIVPEIVELTLIANPDTLYLDQATSATFNLEGPLTNKVWYLDSTFYGATDSTIISFLEEETYHLAVEGYSEHGCRYGESLQYQVYLETPVVLSSPKRPIQVAIQPVPATTEISVSSAKEFHFGYEIIDQNGKIFKSLKTVRRQDPISIEELPNGIYFLRIIDAQNRLQSIRFIKK